MKKQESNVNQDNQNDTSKVEGEGSYTATHRYNEGLERSVQAGKSERLADEAKRALEGKNGDELERAEKIGKSGNPPSTAK